MQPKHYLNTSGGHRIPVYGEDSDWATVGIDMMSKHPEGGSLMDGYGVTWYDAHGMAIAIAGDPIPSIMAKVRAGQPVYP